MSRHRATGTPLRPEPRLGDSWVVQSDEEDLYSPHETDSAASDGNEYLTSAGATGAGTSEFLAATRNRPSEELPVVAGPGELVQKRKVRQSPRVSAGGRGSISTLQGPTAEMRSVVNSNDSVQLSPNPATSSISTRKRHSRTNVTPMAEPDLVMPSIHENNLGGSWVGDKNSSERNISTKAMRNLGGSSRREKAAYFRLEEARSQRRLEKGSKTMVDMATSIGGWMIDVLGKALSTLKTPLSLILAGYILVGLLLVMRNLLTSSIYSALSPLCRIPGSSFLHLPMCHTTASVKYRGSEPPPVHFDDLMAVQSKFEAVLEESAGGVSLPLDMKRGEASIRDLRQIVRYSGLRSKN